MLEAAACCVPCNSRASQGLAYSRYFRRPSIGQRLVLKEGIAYSGNDRVIFSRPIYIEKSFSSSNAFSAERTG